MKKLFLIFMVLISVTGCATFTPISNDPIKIEKHIQINQSQITYTDDPSRSPRKSTDLVVDVGEPLTVVFPRAGYKTLEVAYYCGLDNNQIVFATYAWINSILPIYIKYPKETKTIKISNWWFNVLEVDETQIHLTYIYAD